MVDAPIVFVDPLAAYILGPGGDALLDSYRASADETARLRGTLAVRHVIAEEVVDGAVARGVRQCVILGAGLDTFAYRHRHAGLFVFELDHPATQAWKRDLLRDAAIEVSASVRFVAMDLERDDLPAALASAGFDHRSPAVFVVLGVTPYLTEDTIFRLLAEIGGTPGGAEIVLDYTEPYENAPAPVRAAYAAVATRLAAGGEPWITLFEPGELHRALADHGFAEVHDLDAAALTRRFCAGRSDGLTIAALVHVLHARSRGVGDCNPAPDRGI